MDTINHTTNDSLFLPWNNNYDTSTHDFDYNNNEGVPPPIYNDHNTFYNTDTYNNNYRNPPYSSTVQPQQQRVINDHFLPMVPVPPSNLATNVASTYNYNSNNNINGITHYNNNNITMPAITASYENDTTSLSPSSGPHYSPKYSPKQSQNVSTPVPVPTGHNMENMVKMNAMMKEMKQHMNDMMIITNMNNMNAMLNHTAQTWNNNHNKQKDLVRNDMPLIHDSRVNSGYVAPREAGNNLKSDKKEERVNKKRRLDEFMDSQEDEYAYEEEEEECESNYPEIGVRATTTIQLSKHLFIGYNLLHFDISREILLAAIKRITEYRWIHSKYNINAEKDVKYLLFINESDIHFLPKAFQENKRKRGRPPKNKKIKLDESKQNKNMKQYNLNVNNDKIYRLNFQIIFKYNIKAQIRSEIIKNIKIDLNKNSLSALLTNVLAQNVSIMDNIQSYSLYAVDAFKLKEYEKYEMEEEERKKKKREREQKRRENKKKEDILSQ